MSVFYNPDRLFHMGKLRPYVCFLGIFLKMSENAFFLVIPRMNVHIFFLSPWI